MAAIGLAGMNSPCYHNHIRLLKVLRLFPFGAGDGEERDFHSAERVAQFGEVQKRVVPELVEEKQEL